MEDVPDSQPMAEIQVGGTWTGSPRLRVFIDDDECVGVLTGQSTRSFPVGPGIRKVKVVSHVFSSETWYVSLSPGDRATLECGFHRVQASGLSVMTLVLTAVGLVTSRLHLNLTSAAALGLALVGMVITGRSLHKPGNVLYLRPRTAQTVPATEMAPLLPRPRITIRQGMVVVAIAAVLLAVAAQELRMQRQSQYLIQAIQFRDQAMEHARSEINWKTRDDQRRAAYHAQLKEKYLYAADHPWEPVEDDPPYPE